MLQGNLKKELYDSREIGDGSEIKGIALVNDNYGSIQKEYPWTEDSKDGTLLDLVKKYADLSKEIETFKKETSRQIEIAKKELLEKDKKVIEKEIEGINSELAKTIEKIKEIQGDDGKGGALKEVWDEIDTSKKQIDNQKLTIIEALGIFVALFTFISIDFQVFRSYRDYHAISGLTLIFLGSISLFIIVFDCFIFQARKIKYNKREGDSKERFRKLTFLEKAGNNISRIILSCISIALVVSGIWLFSRSPNEDIQESKNTIKNETFEYTRNNLENRINDFQKEKLKNNNEESVSMALESLKKCVRDFGFTYKCFKDD
jgi:hypothetical protein